MLVALTDLDLKRLAQIVRDETGNQVQEKNFSMIESRIRAHVLKLGLKSMDEYWSYFTKNEHLEREALLGLMTTHYTFFFREYAHFEVLEKWIDDELPRLKKRFEASGAPVHVWSAACSRGQEVYSLAMFLEIHLTQKYQIPFIVQGTDIDAESVSYAKNGVYPIKEVNTIPHLYLNQFWKKGSGPVKDFAALHPKLKAKTVFQPLNLLELSSWNPPHKFDVIFCRNVFIYFSEENVRSIAKGLQSKMETQGLFISGVSEPLRFSDWNLQPVGPSAYLNIPLEQKKPENKTKPTISAAEPVSAVVRPQEPGGKRYRVLCVDDSTTIQLLMKKVFSQDPLCERIDIAVNGQDARNKLDAGKYDVMTLDIHMPEVNGIEFLERFYNKKLDPPVVMVSSVNRTDLDLATKAMQLGAFDYVEKPAMNNLQKSATEILTKAKMALRKKEVTSQPVPENFDASIGKKIVVPDASLCLRIVCASPLSLKSLE